MKLFKKPYFLKTRKEKKLDLLNDTINYYNTNNRGIDPSNGKCSYAFDCAIGRLIPDMELKKKFGNLPINLVYDHLPNKLKKFDLQFLTFIQNLHDIEENWNEKGLSQRGKEQVEFIKRHIK